MTGTPAVLSDLRAVGAMRAFRQGATEVGSRLNPGMVFDNIGMLLGFQNFEGGQSPLSSLVGLGSALGVYEQLLTRLGVNGVALKAAPTPVVPYAITGTTHYINSAVTGPGAGTTGDPFKTLPGTHVPGDGYLFVDGSPVDLSGLGPIIPSASGTSSNKIIFGVYDPVTFARISGRVTNATINAGSSVSSLLLRNHDYICVEGFRCTGAANVSFGTIQIDGTSANCQILNCEVLDAVGRGVLVTTSGKGNVVQGCHMARCATGDAINFILANGDDTCWQYNVCTAILNDDNGGTFTYVGTVACNSISGATNNAGISVSCAGGAFQVYRNSIRLCAVGVGFGGGPHAAAVDCSGAVVQNNACYDIGSFGLSGGNVKGTWQVTHNRCYRVGSYDGGITPALGTKFGRGYEFWGMSAATGAMNGLLAFNYCEDVYNFADDGTEGVGYGLDNNSFDIDCRNNICKNTGGNGIQLNSNVGKCKVRINTVINPATGSLVISADAAAGIMFIQSPNTYVGNNTVVLFGLINQKHGISESATFLSTGSTVENNLILGATVSGIRRNTAVGGTAESNNKIEGGPAAVVSLAGVVVANGASTELLVTGATGAAAPYYAPRRGSAADAGAKLSADFSMIALDGDLLISGLPVGSMHVQ